MLKYHAKELSKDDLRKLEGNRKKDKVSGVEQEAEPPNHGTQQMTVF
jgi:hypothetical protein